MRLRTRWPLILATAVLLSGCSYKFFDGHKEHIGHVPPNSNVKLLGTKVTGEASTTYFYLYGTQLLQPSFSTDLMHEAIRNALAGTGGDILVNVDVMKTSTTWPLFLFTIITSTIEVEGQPAKIVEVGRQELY